MDKLIKTLELYCASIGTQGLKINYYDDIENSFECDYYDYNSQTESDELISDSISYLEVISKKFGFIKWLVENDKLKETEEIDYLEDYFGGTFTEYENTIMILSISDNPIQDLINMLN